METNSLIPSIADILPPDNFPGMVLPADSQAYAGIQVIDQDLVQTVYGPVLLLTLYSEEELAFQLPGLPVSVILQGSGGGNSARVQALLSEDWYLDVEPVRLLVRFDRAILHPLDSTRQYAAIQFDSGLHLTAGRIMLRPPGVEIDLPASEIASTGIQIALQGLVLAISDESVPPEVFDLGFDTSFRGVYARYGSLRFLTMLRFGNQNGIELKARDLAVSAQGVSCTLEHVFSSSDGAGVLFSVDWPFELREIVAAIRDNHPEEFSAQGLLSMPFFNQDFDLDFGLSLQPGGGFGYSTHISALQPVDVDTTFGSLHFDDLALDGELVTDQVTLSGIVTRVQVDLLPLTLSIESAEIELSHNAQQDELRLELRQIQLGPLGIVELAKLMVAEQRLSGQSQRRVYLETTLDWHDLRSRLSIPTNFPAPPDDGRVQITLSWEQDPAGATKLKLSIAAELVDVDNLWAFLPADLRPEVRRASLDLSMEYSSPGDFANASQTDAFSGQMNASLEVRFPQLAGLDDSNLISIHTGDPQGWIAASLSARADAQGQLSLAAQISNPISVDFNLPGLTQASPPLHLALTGASIALATGGSAGAAQLSQGEISMSGNFAIRPIEFPPQLPIASQLKELLKPLSSAALAGEVTGSLKFKDGRLQWVASCDFADARLEVGVFKLLENLSRGRATPAGETDASRAQTALDLKIGFGLHHLAFQFGDLESIEASNHAQVELGMQFRFGDFSAVGYLRLSDRELAVGIDELLIPLQMPRFPLTTAELDALRSDAQWQTGLARLEQRVTDLEALYAANNDPATLRELGQVQAKLALLLGIWDVRQKVTGTANKTSFQENVRFLVDAMQAYNGLTSSQSNVQLKVSSVQAIIPFGDPRNLAFEGSASLIGFDASDPFKALEEMTLTAGISADMIYFSLDSLGSPIPIPDFGRYTHGSISISKFSLGYGYTKNSFAAAFQGEITLPPQLIADLDTSRSLGMGVRLPHYSSLAFRLDLIPVPGPIPVIPQFEFNLDLRSPGAPSLLNTDTCEPFYDGLELFIPNVIHADFKKLAFSPFFSILPIPNIQFDGDLLIGNRSNGVTIVADNLLFLFGLVFPPGIYPVPFLASPDQPYFDHLCIRFGIAGFGVNFNLERPFPSFNPLALLEAAGLIADPTMPIDPNGTLANTVRMALTDAYFFLPRFAHVLFPEAREVDHKELNIEINVGTLITVAQAVLEVIKTALDEVNVAGKRFDRAVRQLANQPPDLSLGALLSALPPEVRKTRLAGSFAGFEASVVILLLSPEDAAQEFTQRDRPPAAANRPRLRIGAQPDAKAMVAWQPNLPVPAGKRTASPQDARSNLFRGIEFEAFDQSDLTAIPAPSKPLAGVIVGAHVKVFGGQRYRFLGALFEDGSFAMITAIDIRPLNLKVAGITVGLPLEISGRLKLEGRQKRTGYFGGVTASAWGRWNIIPGIARMDIADKMNPASLTLYSDGKFAVQGNGQARLFNGAAKITGKVDISHTHAFVDGEFRYTVQGLVDLLLQGSARFGPGPRFALAGKGTLDILDHRIAGVSGVVSESGAAIKAQIDTTGDGALQWRVAGQRVNLQMDLLGEFMLSKTSKPIFNLEGRGMLELPDSGNAKITGRSYIRGEMIDKKGQHQIAIGAEGALDYLGRRWLQGYIEIGTRRTKLGGRTSFVIDLTPSNVSGVELAHLFFKIELQGDFILNTSAGIADLSLNGDWLLAARFGTKNDQDSKSTDTTQILPLAANVINLPSNFKSRLKYELLHVKGFTLVPNGTLKIPVPEIVSSPIKFGLVDTVVPAITYKDEGLRMIPEGIPPNFLLSDDLHGSEVLFSIPNYEVTLSPAASIDIPLDGEFGIFLVIENNELCVVVE